MTAVKAKRCAILNLFLATVTASTNSNFTILYHFDVKIRRNDPFNEFLSDSMCRKSIFFYFRPLKYGGRHSQMLHDLGSFGIVFFSFGTEWVEQTRDQQQVQNINNAMVANYLCFQ